MHVLIIVICVSQNHQAGDLFAGILWALLADPDHHASLINGGESLIHGAGWAGFKHFDSSFLVADYISILT